LPETKTLQKHKKPTGEHNSYWH